MAGLLFTVKSPKFNIQASFYKLPSFLKGKTIIGEARCTSNHITEGDTIALLEDS